MEKSCKNGNFFLRVIVCFIKSQVNRMFLTRAMRVKYQTCYKHYIVPAKCIQL